MRSDHGNRAFSLARVHSGEWLAFVSGMAVIVGLALPWSEGATALAEPGLLDLLVLLAGLLALLLPVVVSSSVRTNVPVVYETSLWVFSLIVGLIMVIKLAFPPEGGFETGFWISHVAMLILSLAVWRSVAREN